MCHCKYTVKTDLYQFNWLYEFHFYYKHQTGIIVMKPRTSCKTRFNSYCMTVSVTVKAAK